MKEVSSDETIKARIGGLGRPVGYWKLGSQPRLADSEARVCFLLLHAASYRLEGVHILSLMLLPEPLHSLENKQQEWLLPLPLTVDAET